MAHALFLPSLWSGYFTSFSKDSSFFQPQKFPKKKIMQSEEHVQCSCASLFALMLIYLTPLNV